MLEMETVEENGARVSFGVGLPALAAESKGRQATTDSRLSMLLIRRPDCGVIPQHWIKPQSGPCSLPRFSAQSP